MEEGRRVAGESVRSRARAGRGGLLAVGLGMAVGVGCAELGLNVDDLLGPARSPAGARALDERTVAAGLREALRVGSQNAGARTSVRDGYWGNPRLRIPVPQELADVGRGLRQIGFGRQVDEFELAMNRAAERAAAEAAPVFIAAVAQLTVPDALRILRGPDDAATQYLRRSSGQELERRFAPIVGEKMREVGVVRLYGDLIGQLRALPVLPVPRLDLQQYVTGKAVDGLFLVVAEEERSIRTDPAARVTELLRTVFR